MQALRIDKELLLNRVKKSLLIGGHTLYFLLFSLAVQAQCAMCRASLESNVSDGNVSVSAKLNLGIIYLFVTPYLLFSLVAFLWYRASKKNGKKK